MSIKDFDDLIHRPTLHELAQRCLPAIVELSKLGNADVREVLRSQPQEPPLMVVDGLQGELMLQVEIFATQTGEIAFSQCIGFVARGYAIRIEQSGLSHEDGFYLE